MSFRFDNGMLLWFSSHIPVLILKSQRLKFPHTNNISQINKFFVYSVVIFSIFWSFGTVGFNKFIWEQRSAQPGARRREECRICHYLLWIDSVKPSLLFSNFGCWISKGSFSQIVCHFGVKMSLYTFRLRLSFVRPACLADILLVVSDKPAENQFITWPSCFSVK